MGPTTPPVDLRAPVRARLDRMRVRVYRGPEGFCAIKPRACDLCACVPRCASMRERVRVCVRPGVRVCAVNYSRACVNKTGDFVRMVVAIAWGLTCKPVA